MSFKIVQNLYIRTNTSHLTCFTIYIANTIHFIFSFACKKDVMYCATDSYDDTHSSEAHESVQLYYVCYFLCAPVTIFGISLILNPFLLCAPFLSVRLKRVLCSRTSIHACRLRFCFRSTWTGTCRLFPLINHVFAFGLHVTIQFVWNRMQWRKVQRTTNLLFLSIFVEKLQYTTLPTFNL